MNTAAPFLKFQFPALEDAPAMPARVKCACAVSIINMRSIAGCRDFNFFVFSSPNAGQALCVLPRLLPGTFRGAALPGYLADDGLRQFSNLLRLILQFVPFSNSQTRLSCKSDETTREFENVQKSFASGAKNER